MKVSKDLFISKADSYIGEVLTGRLKSNANKFAFGFIRPVLPSIMDRLGVWEKMAYIGMLDEGGDIDVGMLETCVDAGFNASPVFEFMGVGFERADVDGFISILKASAQS